MTLLTLTPDNQEVIMLDGEDPEVFWQDVTPEIAAEYLQENEANRNLRARVVNAYSRDMKHGKWLPTGETIKLSRTGELLDGQHRLTAIIDSETPQRLLVVKGLHESARAVIDTGATRTAGDALRMAGMGGVSPHAVASAARLMVLWKTDRFKYMNAGMRHEDRATHQEILELVASEPDILDAVQDADRDYTRTGIPLGPGAMTRMVLYQIDAKDAALFFDALSGYSTDGSDDPRAVLLYTIRQMRALGQMRRPGEAVGLVFTTWNAWRDKQKIRSLTTRDSKGRALPIPQPL